MLAYEAFGRSGMIELLDRNPWHGEWSKEK